MFGKLLLQWSEPSGARLSLLRLSGGLRQLFIASLIADGLPTVLILSAVWFFVFLAGAHVMRFGSALTLFAGLAAVIAALQCTMFFAGSQIRITSTHLYIGMRKWRNRAIRRYAWETREVGGAGLGVLAFTVGRGGAVVRVALPSSLLRDEVEGVLPETGIRK
jgi:hypothetical protein